MRKFRAVVLLPVVVAALGCAPLIQRQSPVPSVQPMHTVRDGIDNGIDAGAMYRTGRYFQDRNRYERAIDAYRQTLAANPNHVDARNALGVIYSLQNRTELAEREFKAALGIAPDAARVHNNLGYHLMTVGRVQEALVSFERAHTLDPKNSTVAANIAAARENLSRLSEEHRVMSLDASTVTQRSAPVLITDSEATMRLDRVADGIWELREIAEAKTATGATALDHRSAYRIEISNGNGTTGLARRVSELLAPRGVVERVRLTNNKPFGVVVSCIQYVDGGEQAAHEINANLPVQLPLTRVAGLERSAQVRVLLGKDFPRNAVQAEAVAQTPIKLEIVRPEIGNQSSRDL